MRPEHTLLRIVRGKGGTVEAIEVADASRRVQRIATPRLVLACGAVETTRRPAGFTLDNTGLCQLD